MIMHRLPLDALLCILITSCLTLSGYANITSVECPGEYRQTGCNFESDITIHGSDFQELDTDILLNEQYKIYLYPKPRNPNYVIYGRIETYFPRGAPQGPHEIEIPKEIMYNETYTILVNFGTFYGQDLLPTFSSATPEITTYVDGQSSTQIWTHIEFNITVEVPTTSTTTTFTKKPAPIPSDYLVVVNASGNCVSNSAACKDGKSMIFTGEQFIDGLTSNYFVTIDGIDKARCVVREVSLESLRCELTGITGKKGVYLMTIQHRNTNGNWSSHKTFAGSLILGKEGGSSGWTISYLEPTNSGAGNSVKSTSATVTKVLTIIFAILLAILIIVMIVMCAKCKFIDRKT